MKKFILVLVILLSLCGCKKEEAKEESIYSNIGIVAPTGAPSLTFINYIDDPSFETNSTPSNILSMMSEKSDKRIVVIDVTSGIKAINQGAPYKLAAILTFGNFYIASTGNDDNGQMDVNDKIVLFGQNMIPDTIFHYLFKDKYDSSIEYVSAVSDAGKCLAAGKNLETGSDVDYVFMAEPVLSTVLNNEKVPTYKKASIYMNIQEEYKRKSGFDLIQAGLFVKDDSYIEDHDDFYKHFSENVNKILTDSEYVNSYLEGKADEEVSSIFGVNSKLINMALKTNSIGLGFKNAYYEITDIREFVKLFGIESVNEEIFFK